MFVLAARYYVKSSNNRRIVPCNRQVTVRFAPGIVRTLTTTATRKSGISVRKVEMAMIAEMAMMAMMATRSTRRMEALSPCTSGAGRA